MSTRYRIVIRREAAKELEAIGQLRDRQRVAKKIAALADAPHPPGSKKLKGRDAYRVRQGDYRILYTVADDVLLVEVIKVGHRGSVYR